MTDLWAAHCDALLAAENATILGEGEGWIAWIDADMEHGLSRCFSVLSDDGNMTRTIKIGTVCDTPDVAALLSAVAQYSEREREKALAAIQALEGGSA